LGIEPATRVRRQADRANLLLDDSGRPFYSREGANVALVSEGVTVVKQEGPYGAEGFIRLRAAAKLLESI